MTEESTQAARYQSLRDYLAVLRRYWLVILIIALLGAAAGYANAARQKAVYQSTSQVVFQDPTQNLNIVGIGANTVQTPGALAELNATTATGPDVMNRVRRKLHSPQSAQALASAITPTVIAASGLLQIQASGSTPAYAARLANTVANVVVARDNSQTRAKFRQVASTIQRRIARLKLRSPSAGQLSFYEDELARLETLSSFATSAQLAKPGLVPTAPSSPNKSRDTGIGLAIGLLLGIIAAFVRDSMDRRLRAPADFESTFELPVVGHVRNQTMGLVAFMSNGKKGPERLDVDSFRILRRNLEFLDLDKPPRSVVVTSAVAEEGKTTVATSLAMVMAAAGKRTLLVDCDLRRPDLASRMGVELFPGLAEYLAARAQPQEILRTVLFSEQDAEAAAVAVGAGPDEATRGNGASNGGSSTGSGSPLVHSLVCIPAGAVTDRGSELLGSGRFKEFIEQVTSRYDMVILDSSPLLPVADTLEVLPHVDSVLICARESRTTRDQARAARATLDRFPRRPTGIVLTGIKPRGAAYELYAYSYEYSS
jgi:polysaccharide biosynthesis transport protein